MDADFSCAISNMETCGDTDMDNEKLMELIAMSSGNIKENSPKTKEDTARIEVLKQELKLLKEKLEFETGKQTKIKSVKAWAVVGPEGIYLFISKPIWSRTGTILYFMNPIHDQRSHASDDALNRWNSSYLPAGYRCIPVTITPEGE